MANETLIQRVKWFQWFLREVGACPEARRWCKDYTIRQAWQQCHNRDWMEWLLATAGGDKGLMDASAAVSKLLGGPKRFEYQSEFDRAACDAIRSVVSAARIDKAAHQWMRNHGLE
jgi:hypothetical protein